jgi:hypothetical protein
MGASLSRGRDTSAALGGERAEELATSPLGGWDCREGSGGFRGPRLAGGPGSYGEESRRMRDDRLVRYERSGAGPAGVQGERKKRRNQREN